MRVCLSRVFVCGLLGGSSLSFGSVCKCPENHLRDRVPFSEGFFLLPALDFPLSPKRVSIPNGRRSGPWLRQGAGRCEENLATPSGNSSLFPACTPTNEFILQPPAGRLDSGFFKNWQRNGQNESDLGWPEQICGGSKLREANFLGIFFAVAFLNGKIGWEVLAA